MLPTYTLGFDFLCKNLLFTEQSEAKTALGFAEMFSFRFLCEFHRPLWSQGEKAGKGFDLAGFQKYQAFGK